MLAKFHEFLHHSPKPEALHDRLGEGDSRHVAQMHRTLRGDGQHRERSESNRNRTERIECLTDQTRDEPKLSMMILTSTTSFKNNQTGQKSHVRYKTIRQFSYYLSRS